MARYHLRQPREQSTAIANANYNDKTEELAISFAKGGSHTYSGVPREVAERFFSADSKGKFFNANIRNNY
jgi:lysyl-tRNA synthetase class 2